MSASDKLRDIITPIMAVEARKIQEIVMHHTQEILFGLSKLESRLDNLERLTLPQKTNRVENTDLETVLVRLGEMNDRIEQLVEKCAKLKPPKQPYVKGFAEGLVEGLPSNVRLHEPGPGKNMFVVDEDLDLDCD